MTEPASFTVTAHDAHRWLKSSLTCTSRDANLPMLNHPRLRLAHGYAILVATDRFRIGLVRIPTTDDSASDITPVSLHAVDVKAAAAIIKPSARDRDRPVTFTLDGDTLSYARADDIAGTIRVLSVDFPNVWVKPLVVV